jgi:aspartokinase
VIVVETVAVYWESRIKTYGFQRISGLAIIELACPLTDCKSLGEMLISHDIQRFNAPFILAQELEGTLSFFFCLPERQGPEFHAALKQAHIFGDHHYRHHVGIIFFHGPHFGDRYGIAEAAFSAVSKAGIQIIASGCASSSVYLILAQDDLDRTEQALRKTFEVAT